MARKQRCGQVTTREWRYRAEIHVPKWRHVLLDSNEKKKDASWRHDNLRQYAMCIPMTET